MTATTDLDARYGRTPARRSRRRVIAVITAVLIAIVFGLWVWWAGLLAPAATIDVETTGYSHTDDGLHVTYTLTVATGTAVTCAVEAMDDSFGVVGWKLVEVPASTTRVRQLEADLRVIQPASTGLIHSCWAA